MCFWAMTLDTIIFQQLMRWVLCYQEMTDFREIIVILSFTSDLSITTTHMMARTTFDFIASMKDMLPMLPFTMFYFSHMENLAGIKGSPSPTIPEFSTILRGCRLFQRYLVDMFASINQECLHFIRTQQPRF